MHAPFISDFLSLEEVVVLILIAITAKLTHWVMPRIIRRTEAIGLVGTDVNKPDRPKVPEMGGIAAVLGMSIALFSFAGVLVLFDATPDINNEVRPIYAAMSVMFVAAFVGLIDDLGIIARRSKALFIMFASVPFVVIHPAPAVIEIPFLRDLDFSTSYTMFLFFWIILVPLGVSGCANAINMSAGYNGLESGQTFVIASFLLLVAYVKGSGYGTLLIFAALIGSGVGLYLYNRYPAKVFIGDVGTVSIGALIGTGVIAGGIEVYGVIAILPVFYEAYATIYYKLKGVERRHLCHNPVILEDGRLKPPQGAECYTLPYLILSKWPMEERRLTNVLLSLYAISGAVALVLAMIA